MRLVETLVVRDEADIVGAQIAYHLNAGIDFVIATDHASRDGTTEILDSFARQGYLRRLPEKGPVREVEWRTRMAQLAANDHGADWVIAADADEFWLPRFGTLREALAAVPERFGVVGGVICHFVPRPDDGRMFADRMTTRLSPHAALNDPTSPWRPSPKVVHRADPHAVVRHAGYLIESTFLEALPGWNLFDVLHFPCRSVEQWARKTTRRGHSGADKPLGQYVKGLHAAADGRIDDLYRSLVVDDAMLAAGLEAGVLVEDVRLRDALRAAGLTGPGSRGKMPAPSHPPAPDEVDQRTRTTEELVRAAVNSTALYDAMIVRFQRNLEGTPGRVRALEDRARAGMVERLFGRRLARRDPRRI